MTGSLSYANTRLVAEAVAVMDTFGVVDLEASLPLELNLAAIGDARLIEGAPLRAVVRADSLPLEALTMLTPEVRDATGMLRSTVVVTGTPRAPRFDGALQVWNGAFTVVALDQRYEEVTVDLVLAGEVVTIREARARSDGLATVTGTVTFRTLTDPVLDVTVDFDGFRAVGVDDLEGAAAWGRLRVTGNFAAPTVTGDVTLDDGYVEVPSFGGDEFGAEIAIDGGPRDGESLLEPTATEDRPQPLPWFERLALDELSWRRARTCGSRRGSAGPARASWSWSNAERKTSGSSGSWRATGTFTLRVGPWCAVDRERQDRLLRHRAHQPRDRRRGAAHGAELTGEPIDLQVRVGGRWRPRRLQ